MIIDDVKWLLNGKKVLMMIFDFFGLYICWVGDLEVYVEEGVGYYSYGFKLW